MSARDKIGIAMLTILFCSSAALADCEIVDRGKRTVFDGSSLKRMMVEKKSLTLLNSEFPRLNVIEKTFKGEVQTCTSCTERYVTCSRD